MASPALIALATAVLRVPGTPERILEIGCGEGERTLFLAREYPSARVRGLDPSAEAIATALARTGLDPEGRVAFKLGAPRSLPYPEGFFDLVTQAGGPLRPAETARVLRPGGHLVLVGAWRWREWRLAKQGFEPVASGTVEGEGFHVLRLDPVDGAPD